MTSIMRTPAVVLSDCINALGVTRCLGRRGVPVIALAAGGRGPVVHSRWVRDVWHWNPNTDNLVDLLLQRGPRVHDRPVLFGFSDNVVRALAARQDELGPYYRLRLPAAALADEVMSKRGFAAWAGRLDMPTPKTTFVEQPNEIGAVAAAMTYPCIVKPNYHAAQQSLVGGLKTARACSAEELVRAYEGFSAVMPQAVVQEWIPGGDADVWFCLQYYDAATRPLASFCGRKIRQWPPRCGSTASCEPVESAEMLELTTRFFTELGFQGLCSMEYKRDPRDGRLLMIEPTVGRTDFQSAVANANGVPIPYLAYCDLVGSEPPVFQPRKRPVKWVRWSADRASARYYRHAGELTWWRSLSSIQPPVAWSTWAWDDPMPYVKPLVARFLRRVAERVRRIVGRLRRVPTTVCAREER